MSQAIDKYIDRVMLYANRAGDEATEIRAEQLDHLMSRVEECEAEGMPREDAVFEAIERHGHPRTVGYSLRRKFPLIDIRTQGTARGVIAIGPRAVGIVAFGGAAFGVFAFGGLAVGLVSIGGLVASLLFAWGGIGFVPTGVAYVGVGVAFVAVGGMVMGVVANGGFAMGIWADGGMDLSLRAVDTAPAWAQHAAHLSRNPHLLMWGTLSLVGLFIPTFILGSYAQHREMKRLSAADPWLAE